MEHQATIQDIQKVLLEIANAQKQTEIQFKETDKRIEKAFKSFDILSEKTDKRINKAFELFESQWGKLMESLVEGDLVKILRERGIEVFDTSMNTSGTRNGENYEFDIIAHNGEEIVVVEVKTTLKSDHVKHFVQKMERFKELVPRYKNNKVYGAMAYLKADAGSNKQAINNKLILIRATGNSASIVNDIDFKPRIF